VNTGIDFGVFTFTYYYLGWHILVANPIAWLLAVSNSYVLNSMITFAAETGRRLSVKAYITFIFTQAGGLVANTMTVFILSYFMPAWMAKIPAIGASFIVDFTLSHLVVFRRREELSKS
jgi:putative flippase GtrA